MNKKSGNMYRMHCPICAETKDHAKMESCTSTSELVNLQEIGRILSIHPGRDIAPEIIPRIQNLVRERAYYHAALMELLCLLRSDGKDPVIQRKAGLLIGDYITLSKDD